MKSFNEISDNEKWQAIKGCIKDYDGLFFYGVKTTGIFCRPSCKAKTPIRENVLFFNESAEAIKAGFRPCKKCCPNQEFFQPDLELVKRAKELLDINFDTSINLEEISKQLGVSTSHLAKLFKQHTGFTAIQYIINIRINKSVELLGQADMKILDIAYITGFRSLSNFYKCFKAVKGCTPYAYRKSRKK